LDGSIPNRRFYATELSPCPYRPGRLERRLVTVLDPAEEEGQLDQLTAAGFRRSQRFLYKPVCPGCRACVPTRIPVAAFVPGRTFRKISRRNADLRWSERPARATDEQFLLFRRYIQARHGDGGMADMGWRDYVDMVEEAGRGTRLVEPGERRRGAREILTAQPDGRRAGRPDGAQMALAARLGPDQEERRGGPGGPSEHRLQRRRVAGCGEEILEAEALDHRQVEGELAGWARRRPGSRRAGRIGEHAQVAEEARAARRRPAAR